jgi:tetratricopeptide (TPR) repeat protein
MKSKRRHELQTNELANWMGKKIEKVKPYINLIVLGVLVAILLVVAILFFFNRGKQQDAQAWRSYTIEANKRERDPAALTKVAQSDPDSPAHLWALQAAADTQRDKGIDLLYEERSEGLKELDEAVQLYEEVLRRGKDEPFLQRRARYGLAKALESKGDIDAAIKQYTDLETAAGEYAVGKDAKRQIARLEHQKEFYKSFAEFNPADRDSVGQTTLLPERPDITFPGDFLSLPNRPDISFPDGSGASGGGDFNPNEGSTTDGETDDSKADTVTNTGDTGTEQTGTDDDGNDDAGESQKNPPPTPPTVEEKEGETN